MIAVRPGEERGQTQTWWLDSRHSFSFNQYFDRKYMQYSDLRVINEDWVRGGAGFGTHPHNDMEIVTYVLAGTLAHKDSTGGVGHIRAGEVQRMTAGTGLTPSEYNASETEEVHLYQIWLRPNQTGLTPGYEQKAFAETEKQGRWRVVASPDGRDGSLTINQDATLYLAALTGGTSLVYELPAGRRAWLQVTRGQVRVGTDTLNAGDGAAITDEAEVTLLAENDAEVMLFDLR
jgi:redox-sensitive bicupin YhaK (pirin superfamily)